MCKPLRSPRYPSTHGFSNNLGASPCVPHPSRFVRRVRACLSCLPYAVILSERLARPARGRAVVHRVSPLASVVILSERSDAKNLPSLFYPCAALSKVRTAALARACPQPCHPERAPRAAPQGRAASRRTCICRRFAESQFAGCRMLRDVCEACAFALRRILRLIALPRDD